MDFALTEVQSEIAELFGTILGREATPDRVRASEQTGFDLALWNTLAEAGAFGLAVPEAHGGAGYGVQEAIVVAEAVGAHVAPVPYAEAVAASAALMWVAGDRPRQLAAEIARGATVGVLAVREVVEDRATLVHGGTIADVVVGMADGTLRAASDRPPVRRRPNLGDLPLADRSFDASTPGLASGSEARAAFAHGCDVWRCVTAAALVGAGQRALDIGVAYVSEREQFGKPIGAFQAIAHGLADVATELDGAKLLVQQAAWAIDEREPDSDACVRMAFACASEAANQAALRSLHYHGGYGFMLEYDIQLYYRRIRSWPLLIGSAGVELDRLASALYDRER